jgi:predicted MFS family arabinose efflux permease
MSSSEPVPGELVPERPAEATSSAGDEDDGEGAGPAVLALLTLATFGFATSLTMLGPLLVDLSRGLDVSIGQAGLLAAALAASWAVALALFSQTPGVVVSAAGGALFGLLNASSRPALLALSAELSARHRGAVLGVLSVTNQGGAILGSSVGGLAIGLGGYGALAVTMAVDAALASGLALPLLRGSVMPPRTV